MLFGQLHYGAVPRYYALEISRIFKRFDTTLYIQIIVFCHLCI